MDYVRRFRFTYSGDGIETQTAYFEGTWKEAINYHDELKRRGYVNITLGIV